MSARATRLYNADSVWLTIAPNWACTCAQIGPVCLASP